MTMLWVQKRQTLRGSKIRFFRNWKTRLGMQAAFFTAKKLKMLATNAFDQKIQKKQPTENYYHSSSLIKKEKTLLISTI